MENVIRFPAQQWSPAHAQERYTVRLATTLEEIREAQRLRYEVFSEEYGARLDTRIVGHDVDGFDGYCDHLLVRDEICDRIVGVYRILPPDSARRLNMYYAEHEFFLTRLRYLRDRLVEVGRSCVHPAYRNGAVIALLWSGLAAYMQEKGYEYLMGCASLSLRDGGHNAANVFQQLVSQYLAPVEYHVFPRVAFPHQRLANGQPAVIPPLLKGYLRAGAWICGEPAWDPDFNSADLLLLLPLKQVNPRYRRHFLKEEASC